MKPRNSAPVAFAWPWPDCIVGGESSQGGDSIPQQGCVASLHLAFCLERCQFNMLRGRHVFELLLKCIFPLFTALQFCF